MIFFYLIKNCFLIILKDFKMIKLFKRQAEFVVSLLTGINITK